MSSNGRTATHGGNLVEHSLAAVAIPPRAADRHRLLRGWDTLDPPVRVTHGHLRRPSRSVDAAVAARFDGWAHSSVQCRLRIQHRNDSRGATGGGLVSLVADANLDLLEYLQACAHGQTSSVRFAFRYEGATAAYSARGIAYVAAVNARNAESPTPLPDAQMADWSRWALEQAKRIDPVELWPSCSRRRKRRTMNRHRHPTGTIQHHHRSR